MNKDKLKRLNIELSAHCNYACGGCPNTYMKREKGHMSIDLFKKITDEIEGSVDKVFLWNYGESLMNPSIREIMEYARNSSFTKIMSTNASLFEEKTDLSFLTAADEVIISVNGFSNESYAFHQKKGSLEKVIRGLELAKDTMISAPTEYVLQTVVNKKNIEELDQAITFAKMYGFDRVDFKSFNVMDNTKKTFETYVPKQKEFTRYQQQRSNKIEPCISWMVINWNGDVNPCCWDYKGEHILGNVKEEGVFRVWESDRAVKHRERMEKREYYSICDNCGKDGTLLKSIEVEK